MVRYRLWGGGATVLTACALAMTGAGTPALAAPGSAAALAATPPAGSVPATQTPHLLPGAPAEQVRQLVQCGSAMYAVGSFTQIRRNSTEIGRASCRERVYHPV